MAVYSVAVELKEIEPTWVILVPDAQDAEDAMRQAKALVRHLDRTPHFTRAYKQDKPSVIYTVPMT